MVLKELEVKAVKGMSNEDAQVIVQRAMRFNSEIFFEKGSRKINAKSLMGVISMALRHGEKIMVIIKGEDQDEAITEISGLFERGFKK